MNGIGLRLEKLFSKDENAVIIAVDHGIFDRSINQVNMNKIIVSQLLTIVNQIFIILLT